jgi:N-methylhydantoinase B
MVGSGYGDPLDRDPTLVLQDLFDRAVSKKFASKVYGVTLAASGDAVDEAKTAELRDEMRAKRLRAATPVGEVRGRRSPTDLKPVMRIHECLDVVQDGDGFAVACRKCSQDFGPATGNYKAASVHRVVPKDEICELPPPEGRVSMGAYVEYYCPGCGTLLDVETAVPAVEGGKLEPIWDIQLSADAIHRAAARGASPTVVAAE